VVDLDQPGWLEAVGELGAVTDTDVGTFAGYLQALRARRGDFIDLGARASDHGPRYPHFARMSARDLEDLFARRRRGEAVTTAEADRFRAHMLMEFAEMSCADGLVMQVHPGSSRNHDTAMWRDFGPDIGADIPHPVNFVDGLRAVLNEFGHHENFTLVMFTLDEGALARELAPLAAHYRALRLGAAWWFLDSPDGMRRHRELVSDTAGFYNGAGFNDDARCFTSIPARHDMARRCDSAYLARLVTEHRLGIDEAHEVARLWARDQTLQVYRPVRR
jgi:glucuronate isomerase